MSSGVKRQRQSAASSTVDSSKKRRTQTRAAPKSRGPYRFMFGKYRGKTIQEVHDEDESYIKDYIVMQGMMGRHNILTKYPALRAGLRDLRESFVESDPNLERALDNDQPGVPSIYEYEAMTDKGMMKMNERSSYCRFWEATDRAVVMASHQNAPGIKLDDFKEALEDSRFARFTEFGVGGS